MSESIATQVKLSGYRVGVSVLVEMDGVQTWQGLSFHVAAGKAHVKLRDRVLMTVGAVLDTHVKALAKEIDVDLGPFPYRILDLHPSIRVWEPSSDAFDLGDTSLNWMTLECLIFGDTDGRKYYGMEVSNG